MNNLLIWPIMLPLLAALGAVVWPRKAGYIGITASLVTLVAVILLLQRIANEGDFRRRWVARPRELVSHCGRMHFRCHWH